MSKEIKPFSADVQRCNQNVRLHEQMYCENNEKLGELLSSEESEQNDIGIDFLKKTMKHDREMKRLWGIVRDSFKVIEQMRSEQTGRFIKFTKEYKNAGQN